MSIKINKYFTAYFLLLSLTLSSCTTLRFAGSDIPYRPKIRFEGRLPDVLSETSGLEFYNNLFWSFNDSGGKPELYSFPNKSLQQISTTQILNAENIDWEDISQDENSLYIADTGNNYGRRDTLTIYRIPKNELSENKLSPDAEIKVVYEEKTQVFSRKSRSPFDCEALVYKNDSLFLFTKNWSNESSWIYKFPATPGLHTVSHSGILEPGMLVTGACLSNSLKELWLIGYHNYRPYIVMYDFENTELPIEQFRFRLRGCAGIQAEGICIAHDRIFISYEKSRKKQGLYSINLPQIKD